MGIKDLLPPPPWEGPPLPRALTEILSGRERYSEEYGGYRVRPHASKIGKPVRVVEVPEPFKAPIYVPPVRAPVKEPQREPVLVPLRRR